MNPRVTAWFIIVLIFLSILVNLPKLPGSFNLSKFNWNSNQLFGHFPLKLGLDLQGGTQLVLETQMDKIPADQKDSALDSAKAVIERRVNLYGVSEAVVQSSKLGDQRRILVDLPGVQNASEAAQLVGRTAQLEFKELPASPSAEATQSAILAYYQSTPTGLSGADLQKATVVFNQTEDGSPGVEITFTPDGAKKFAEITKRNVNKPLIIFLDDQILMAPTVRGAIVNGSSVISGGFDAAQAKELSIQLNAGALPVPIQILEQRSIGATLGQESIDKSLLAGVIGLVTVMLFMIAYYGWRGLVADIALIVYTLFILTIFRTGLFLIPPVTLTLAGIAGFILSIGMAVDANILIFERMKEEERWGKGQKVALEQGFKRAWSSIRDSNISSLITAAILYFLGTGPVRGFAVTLAIGVLVSMFTAITVTKTILRSLIR